MGRIVVSKPEVLLKRIIVFSRPRAGSYFVLDLLRNLQGVDAELEIFNKSVTPVSRAMTCVSQRIAEKHALDCLPKNYGNLYHRDAYRFLSEFYTLHKPERTLVFKVIYDQVPPDYCLAIAGQPGTVPLVLERDRLDSLVSFIKAKTTNTWSLSDTTSVYVDIPDRDLLSLCRIYADKIKQGDNFLKRLQQAGHQYITLNYDDLIAYSADTQRQVAYLGSRLGLCPEKELQTVFVKQDRGENRQLKIRIQKLLESETGPEASCSEYYT